MNILNDPQVSRQAGNREALPIGQAKPKTDRRETSDTYRGVIAHLGAFRIAVCGNNLQWLIRLHRAYIGPAPQILHDLPERFEPEGAR